MNTNHFGKKIDTFTSICTTNPPFQVPVQSLAVMLDSPAKKRKKTLFPSPYVGMCNAANIRAAKTKATVTLVFLANLMNRSDKNISSTTGKKRIVKLANITPSGSVPQPKGSQA